MMMQHIRLLVFISLFCLYHCLDLKLSSVQKKYDRGVKAYSNERWSECIEQFEQSLNLYKFYRSITVNCRLKCNSEQPISVIKNDMENLKVIEKFIYKKKCLIKCLKEGFNGTYVDIDINTIKIMQERKPYEYLHICYLQMNAFPKAASAVYTYLVIHPEDVTTSHNLQYYITQPEVDPNEVVDLESADYLVLYRLGLKAYNQKNWASTVANMEEVLTDYLSSENNCRVECEQIPVQDQSMELSVIIFHIFASYLECQQHCQVKLKVLNYDSGIAFLADVLNFIQISYYRLGRYEDAAKAVATYLLLLPDDQDMLENKKIYSTLVGSESFTARHDIEYYLLRDKHEKKLNLMNYKDIESNFI